MEQQYTSLLAAQMRMGPSNGSYPWFALRVRSRYENTVATILGGKGYEWFLPLYKSRRPWSDRIKEIQLPLFPGYIFCRFDLQHRLPILTTPGVVTVVGIDRKSTRLNSSHGYISYAVFCLKKKKNNHDIHTEITTSLYTLVQ